MLSSVHKAFIDILSDHINERASALPSDLDKLSEIAISQRCEAIFYYQLHIEKLFEAYSRIMFSSVNQKNIINKLHSAFAEASIPFIIFKGTEIAKYYSKPQLRSMSDIDILVHEDDKKKSSDVLEKMGFSFIKGDSANKPDDHEWEYFKGDFVIELHHRLLYSDEMNDELHISYTDKAWEFASTDDGIYYKLETEFHFIYVLLHLLKHLLYSGADIRPFLDLAVMTKNANMNWTYLEKTLNELKLLEFAKVCFSFVGKFFDASCPLVQKDADNAFLDDAAEKILNGEALLNEDGESYEENKEQNIFRKENNGLGDVAGKTVHTLFPDFSYMKTKYPKLEALGFFGYVALPFMWAVRIAVGLFKNDGVTDSISKTADFLKKRNKREKTLKKWGL